MELDFARQSAAFLYSIPLGAALGIVYGALKLIRSAFTPKKGAVIALDIAYMLFCSLCVFYFSLGYLDGYVRVYVILGALIGFFIYRLTLGGVLQRILNPIISFLKRIIGAILTKIKIIAKKLLKNGCDILYNVGGRIVLFMSANLYIGKKSDKYGKKSKGKGSAGADGRAEDRS